MADRIKDALERLLWKGEGLCIVDSERAYSPGELAKIIEREMGRIPSSASGPVFTHVGNSVDLLVRFFAMILRGLRPVVLPAVVPEGELLGLLDSFEAIPYYVPGDGFTDGRGNRRPVPSVSDEYSIVLPTSGSTGQPRLIAGRSDNICACVEAIAGSQGLKGLCSTGAVLPAHFSYCLVNQVMWSLLEGAQLVLTPGVSMPGPTLDLIRHREVDFVCLVAQQMRILLRLGFDDDEFVMPSVRVVNFAGGPFAFDCWNALIHLFPNARFNNNYGCTEAFPRVSARRVLSGEEPISEVGRAIDGLKIWICDDDGRVFPRGKVGRIYCKGRTTGVGQLRPDGSVEPFSEDGSFPTGDYGKLTTDGVLHVYGRADQVINVGGERVSLIKIESVMRKCPGVEDAIATSMMEENGEQWPLVVLSGRQPPVARTLRQHMEKHLSRASWPRKVFHTSQWPMLPSDKPDRKKVIALAKAGEFDLTWTL